MRSRIAGAALACSLLLALWLWPSHKKPIQQDEPMLSSVRRPVRHTVPKEPVPRRLQSIPETTVLTEMSGETDHSRIPLRFAEGLFPRDPEESQRWRLDTQFTMRCDSTVDCCAAKACVGGICTGCSASGDCLAGEACVIDHCIPTDNTECTTRHDCEAEQLCVLERARRRVERGVVSTSSDCRNNSSYSSTCELNENG